MEEIKAKEAKAQHLAQLINQLESMSIENAEKLRQTPCKFSLDQFESDSWPDELVEALHDADGVELVHFTLSDNSNKGYKMLAKRFGEAVAHDNLNVLKAVMELSSSPKIVCHGLFPLIPYSLTKWYLSYKIRNAEDRGKDQECAKTELLLTILLNLSSTQPTPSCQIIPGLLPLESPVILLSDLLKSSFADLVRKLESDILVGLDHDPYLSSHTRYHGKIDKLASMEELDIVATDGSSPLLLLFILQNVWNEPSLHPLLTSLPSNLKKCEQFLSHYTTPDNHRHTYQTELVLALLSHLATRVPLTRANPTDLIPLTLLDSCECIRKATLQVFDSLKPATPTKALKCQNVGCPNREPFPGCYVACSCKNAVYCSADCQWEHFERCNHVADHKEQDMDALMGMMPRLIESFQKVKDGDASAIESFTQCMDMLQVQHGQTTPAVPILGLATFGKVKCLLDQTPVNVDEIEAALSKFLTVYPLGAEAIHLRGRAREAAGMKRQALMDYYVATQLLRWDWRRKHGDVTLEESESALKRLTEEYLGCSVRLTKLELGRPDMHGVLLASVDAQSEENGRDGNVYKQLLQAKRFDVGQASDGTGGTLESHGDSTTLESASRIFIEIPANQNQRELSFTRRRMQEARRHFELALANGDAGELEKALLMENRHLSVPWTEFPHLTPILSVFQHSWTPNCGDASTAADLSSREKAAFYRACSEVCVRRGMEKEAIDWLLRARECPEEWVASVLLAHAVETGVQVTIDAMQGDALQEHLLCEYIDRLKFQKCDKLYEEVDYAHVAANLSRLLLKQGKEDEAREWFIQSKLHAPLTRFLWRGTHGGALSQETGPFDKELEKASFE